MTRESLVALLTLLGLALQLESLAAGGHAMSFIIKTTGLLQGETIPTKYTCDEADVSPGLTWTGAPEGTKSLSLIADDLDAPVGKHDVAFVRSSSAGDLSPHLPPILLQLLSAAHTLLIRLSRTLASLSKTPRISIFSNPKCLPKAFPIKASDNTAVDMLSTYFSRGNRPRAICHRSISLF